MSSEHDPEAVAILKLDLLFKQIEVRAPCCENDEDRKACFALLDDARKILKGSSASEANVRKFGSHVSARAFQAREPSTKADDEHPLAGILSFNLGLLELKQVPEKAGAEDADKTEAHRTAAIQWTGAAAELFGGCNNKSLYGEALTVSTALQVEAAVVERRMGMLQRCTQASLFSSSRNSIPNGLSIDLPLSFPPPLSSSRHGHKIRPARCRSWERQC